MLLKSLYRLDVILKKINAIDHKLLKKIIKSIWDKRRNQISKTILKKENKNGTIDRVSYLKDYTKQWLWY